MFHVFETFHFFRKCFKWESCEASLFSGLKVPRGVPNLANFRHHPRMEQPEGKRAISRDKMGKPTNLHYDICVSVPCMNVIHQTYDGHRTEQQKWPLNPVERVRFQNNTRKRIMQSDISAGNSCLFCFFFGAPDAARKCELCNP